MRKKREEFRKKLVSLIVSKDDSEGTEVSSPDNSDFPNAEEREIMRYYYYIKHGIDTIHVAPMDAQVLNK